MTTENGCDSIAVLNLTINNPDTSYTNITECESYNWNGNTYTEGSYYYYEENNNQYSLKFDGIDDNFQLEDLV